MYIYMCLYKVCIHSLTGGLEDLVAELFDEELVGQAPRVRVICSRLLGRLHPKPVQNLQGHLAHKKQSPPHKPS